MYNWELQVAFGPPREASQLACGRWCNQSNFSKYYLIIKTFSDISNNSNQSKMFQVHNEYPEFKG